MATGTKTCPEMSAISASPNDPEIRILLMGRKASGKSSCGNKILGQKIFKVHIQQKKNEAEDEFGEVCDGKTQICGKQVAVIDCPDLLDPDLNKEKLEIMKEQLVSRCLAGLSAVLLTVPLVKNVENEEEILDFIIYLLGPHIQKYIMILFTREDELEELDQTIDEHLQQHTDLKQLVTQCEGKIHCFNNKCKSDGQVRELLQNIEKIMVENGGKFIMEQMKKRNSKETSTNFSGESPAEVSHTHDQIPEKKDLRLVLLGRTGVGKSATGNTIIGKNLFESLSSSNSQTKQCQSETRERFRKKISVIDTPGLYDTELNNLNVQKEIVKCITYASPGPHAFIIVIRVDRFTEENKKTVEQLKEVFGEEMEKYTIILFTYKDNLDKDKKTIEEFVQESEPDLKKLVESCGNRFFCLDNNSASFPQFKELLKKIEKMVEENEGTHFTNVMFNETEKCIQKIQKQKLDEKEKQYKQQHKRSTQTEWQKIYWRLAEESRHEAEQSFSDACIAAVAQLLKKVVVTPEEKESVLKEAESKGISHTEAIRLAIRATRKLAKQTMCGVQ